MRKDSTFRGKADRSVRLSALWIITLLAVFAWAGTASAKEPAEIVFDSGGRVMSLDASGTDRSNLTPSSEVTANYFEVPTSTPSISGDGKHLAYLRHFYIRGWPNSKMVIANRDGAKPKIRLNSRKFPLPGTIDDLSWGPSGRLFAVEFLLGGTKLGYNLTRITSMNPNGSGRRVELKRIYHGVRDSFIVQAEVSPDGRRILFTSMSGGGLTRLEMLNRHSGKVSVLRNRAEDGSWSPDGKRILFQSDRTGIRDSCFRGRCFGDSKVFIAKSDGTKARRLTKGRGPGNESGADWSPDGSRIVLASDRNNPSLSEGRGKEIYSVRPDGSCLTWLTNGTPASSDPSWAPEKDRDFAPSKCGAVTREPLVEVVPDAHPLVNGAPTKWPQLWFGPVFEGWAQSNNPYDGRELEYADCVYFRTAECRRPEWQLSSDDVCLGWVEQLTDLGRFSRVILRRGALVFLPDFKHRGSEAVVLTGGQGLMISSSPSRGRKHASTAQYLRAIDALQPVSSGNTNAKLQPPQIDGPSANRAKLFAAVVAKTGSIRGAAAKLHAKPALVRNWLKVNLALKKFGPVSVRSCRGWFVPSD